jgi:uncharacterized protein YdcH (DUF465 family)
MKKGKSRRYREARELKQLEVRDPEVAQLFDDHDEAASPVEECAECRRSPHADWCMAEEV